jgi:hypothetical protein
MQQITENVCPICGTTKKLVPAGISKRTGQPYDEFWACPLKCKKTDGTFKPVDYSSKQVEEVKIVDKDAILLSEFNALRIKVEELIDVIKKETSI